MGERHVHEWRRDGPVRISRGGVAERCVCGRKRMRKIVRCPDCAEARFAQKIFNYQTFPCETCDGRGWVDAPKDDPATLCCCYRFAGERDRWCDGCKYKGHAMEVHQCDVIADEADAAWREKQYDALLDPPAPRKRPTPEALARANDAGW